MIKQTAAIICLLFFSTLNIAQDAKVVSSDVVVHDTLIDFLFEAHKDANSRNGHIDGYRVHIYTDSGIRSKLRTDKTKEEFDEKYPDINSYISYNEPNYRIRVGDFRSRLDASRFLQEIRKDYPSAYIIQEKINYPILD